MGLKPVVDFCGVACSGETAAGIAKRSRLQKSATAIQQPSWDLFSASLGRDSSDSLGISPDGGAEIPLLHLLPPLW
jgi:hypothetical protein